MKTGFIVALAMATLLVGGCPGSGGGEPAGVPSGGGAVEGSGKATGKLTFTPPEGWEVTWDADEYTPIAAHRPPEPGDEWIENMVLVRMSKVLIPKTLEEFTAKQLERAAGWFKNTEVVSNEPVKIGDVEAREVVFTCSEYNVSGMTLPYRIKQWYVLGSEDGYTLTAASTETAWVKYGAAIDAAARTLRWE